ncbi:hypothetical protein HanXRQr2_Chr11g0486301 [Helianthus annuus]|uniref:Uncharacterized protein n=1 Tax=Helianthus annuus TaxID=4232 RepID=A0A9K3MZN6_HELAN|nr:hypothetical protein HanXRQr2_Chr11g0486301 [Helianthus annuus]KAJ0874787.1 hypothetical protein HanPSC8_Chr11g0468411 [Helianthus annuus]
MSRLKSVKINHVKHNCLRKIKIIGKFKILSIKRNPFLLNGSCTDVHINPQTHNPCLGSYV